MDGLAAVTARVQQIQGLVQGMQPVTLRTTVGALSGTTGSPATTAAPGSSGAAFDQLLTQARAAQATPPGPGGAAPTAPSRAVGADGVPVDLARYGNGKVPASALQPLGVGEHRLWAPAAESFARLRAAAAADGVTIGVTDSYRSYDEQVDLVRRKGLYSRGGLAAAPGTSDHGWGMALDLKLDDRAQSWMRANAGRFGFAEDTPREPWHWGFTP